MSNYETKHSLKQLEDAKTFQSMLRDLYLNFMRDEGSASNPSMYCCYQSLMEKAEEIKNHRLSISEKYQELYEKEQTKKMTRAAKWYAVIAASSTLLSILIYFWSH